MANAQTQNTKMPPTLTPYTFAAEEDRCAPRHQVAIPAKMRFSGSSSFDTEVANISLAGFACDALLQVHPGTRCWLTLPGLAPLEAEVIHRSNFGLGCALKTMLNPAVLDRYIAAYPARSAIPI
ncbi:PilZ domain-containing protein [Parasphingorhabdus cellanae]|uniref:PilZ domain-containing protein n=1 Tax=Parasphingorhabdus cellanae TaxID=2806553 RepID=A0ABX7T0A3_9SPHN|nr:PilZ domain-containing protein [Parasphingorhabdus cellanae]QTD54964.1 PilZ domain-containing protein [Parasphingorhabdus cellanae]